MLPNGHHPAAFCPVGTDGPEGKKPFGIFREKNNRFGAGGGGRKKLPAHNIGDGKLVNPGPV